MWVPYVSIENSIYDTPNRALFVGPCVISRLDKQSRDIAPLFITRTCALSMRLSTLSIRFDFGHEGGGQIVGFIFVYEEV